MPDSAGVELSAVEWAATETAAQGRLINDQRAQVAARILTTASSLHQNIPMR